MSNSLPLENDRIKLKESGSLPFGGIAYGRKSFVTETGFIGLGPRASLAGDEIVALLGGTVPYVVRRVRENIYSFVGECYVFGIMNGEVLSNQAKPKDLEIRLI